MHRRIGAVAVTGYFGVVSDKRFGRLVDDGDPGRSADACICPDGQNADDLVDFRLIRRGNNDVAVGVNVPARRAAYPVLISDKRLRSYVQSMYRRVEGDTR